MSSSNRAGSRYGGRMNQIFILTCVASFFLQLFGSIVSWSSSSGYGSLLEAHSMLKTRGGRQLTDAEIAVPEIETSEDHKLPERLAFGAPRHNGRLRVLLGILTADFFNDQAYRKRHRNLFKLWNDPRVCSLPDFKELPINERYRCEIIYTFVMGGNPEAPPELVDDSRPMFVTKPIKGNSPDLNDPDVTLVSAKGGNLVVGCIRYVLKSDIINLTRLFHSSILEKI